MESNLTSPRGRHWLIWLAVAVAIGGGFYLLRGVLAPVALASLLAYLFAPLVRWLAAHRWHRSLAAALCLVFTLLLAVGFFALLVPSIHHELKLVASHVPAYVEKIQRTVLPWLEEHLGWNVSEPLGGPLKSVAQALTASAQDLALPAAKLFGNVLSSVVELLVSLIWLVLVPLFTYYFLVDYERIIAFFAGLVPPARRPQVFSVFAEIDGTLSSFLRGQGTVCLILALVYALALSLAGVPAGVTIGVVSGLFNFVPYVGTATGLILSALFLLLEGGGATGFLVVGAIFLGVNLLDGVFLTPRILGKRLGLAPVAVILAVLAFGEVFGFLGVLLAVPLTAIGKVLAARALKSYRTSRLFAAPDEGGSDRDAKNKTGSQ